MTSIAARPTAVRRAPWAAPRLPSVDHLLTVAVFMLLAGAVVPGLASSSADPSTQPGTGSPVMQLLWGGIYVAAGLAVWRRSPGVVHSLRREGWLVGLVGMAVLSTSWSIAPSLTLRRSVALCGTLVLASYLISRFSWIEIVRLLAVALGILSVVNLLVALVLPDIGTHPELAGAWRGLAAHKNALGQQSTVAVLVLALAGRIAALPRWPAFVGSVVAAALVVGAQSATSLVITAMVPVAVLLLATRWGAFVVVTGLAVATLYLVLSGWTTVVRDLAGATELLGRDITLTGRVPLWQSVLATVGQRPWLGFGYGAFWRGGVGPSGYIWSVSPWRPPNSHNGFMDLALDLGLVGMSIMTASMATTVRRSLALVRSGEASSALLPLLGIPVLVITANIVESNLVAQSSLLFVLFAAAALSLADAQVHLRGAGEHAISSSRYSQESPL